MSSPMAPQRDPVEASRSMLNPQDVALKMQRGEMGQEMTIGDFLKQAGIDLNDPLKIALQKIKQQAMNATPQGKIQSIAGGSPAGPPMGGGAPPMGGQPSPQPPQGRGLAGLMGR